FSPDGSKLAISVFLIQSRSEIWILPMPAGKPYHVFPGLPVMGAIYRFSWTRDGRSMVFSSEFLASSNEQLFLGDIERGRIWPRNEDEGSERPVVTQKDFGSDRTSNILDVMFSPDGQRIAYRRQGEHDESIWISTLAGDPPVRLAREPGGLFQRGPSWSPDG